MPVELHIPWVLPSLNEVVAAAKQRHGNWSAYATMKRNHQRAITALIRAQRIPQFARVRLKFEWREPSRRRDLDNVAAGGRKLILDALVTTGVIPGDGWKHVTGWEDVFDVSRKSPGVTVSLIEAES